MVGAIILKVFLYFIMPFGIGWLARGAWNRWTERVRRQTAAELEQKKRVQLLQSASNDELLDELSKPSREITR